MHYFRKYYKKETLTNFRGTLNGGCVSVFSADVDMRMMRHRNLQFSLEYEKSESKIRELFHYWSGKMVEVFINEQAQKFINLVNRRIVLSIAQVH